MRKVAVLDTSIMSFNIGDQIIMESARKGLEAILEDAFVVNMPTHSPLFRFYEFSLRGKDSFKPNLDAIDLKFVCGTNLLEKNMKKRKNTWNIHIGDLHYFKDFILVGVGTDGLPAVSNNYTKKFYQKALSSDYIHSTRDEETKEFLESIGIKAINTGCPTIWGLNKEHCSLIPKTKKNNVVFTVTDYKPDISKDRIMIDILCENYSNVYCWIQGSQDIDYLNTLGVDILHSDKIKMISPSLEAYNKFLDNVDCDFVGTRLHAGIKAMQKYKRAIIIGVDNRARAMNIDYNFNFIEREEIEKLEDMINTSFATEINLNERNINAFLHQFN